MTSTNVFYAANTTLTVHMPPGASEAVLMVEALDNVASITLPLDEVRRLISTLQDRVDASDATGSPAQDDLMDKTPLSSSEL